MNRKFGRKGSSNFEFDRKGFGISFNRKCF